MECYDLSMARTFKYVVYKLTFPNGKIYIGMDIGNSLPTLNPTPASPQEYASAPATAMIKKFFIIY